MQNYKVRVYVISMEFSAVNRRRLSRETNPRAGSEEGRLFSQASHNRRKEKFDFEVSHLELIIINIFLFKHIHHCLPQKHLGLSKGLTIIHLSGLHTNQTETNGTQSYNN